MSSQPSQQACPAATGNPGGAQRAAAGRRADLSRRSARDTWRRCWSERSTSPSTEAAKAASPPALAARSHGNAACSSCGAQAWAGVCVCAAECAGVWCSRRRAAPMRAAAPRQPAASAGAPAACNQVHCSASRARRRPTHLDGRVSARRQRGQQGVWIQRSQHLAQLAVKAALQRGEQAVEQARHPPARVWRRGRNGRLESGPNVEPLCSCPPRYLSPTPGRLDSDLMALAMPSSSFQGRWAAWRRGHRPAGGQAAAPGRGAACGRLATSAAGRLRCRAAARDSRRRWLQAAAGTPSPGPAGTAKPARAPGSSTGRPCQLPSHTSLRARSSCSATFSSSWYSWVRACVRSGRAGGRQGAG